MEVIDKAHTEVKKHKLEVGKFISFCQRGIIYLSQGAAMECELTGIKYLHFVIDKGKLYFYLDDNAASGYCVTKSHKTSAYGGYRMQSNSLFEILKSKTGVTPPNKFLLLETNIEYEGNILTQVLLHSPYKKKK